MCVCVCFVGWVPAARAVNGCIIQKLKFKATKIFFEWQLVGVGRSGERMPLAVKLDTATANAACCQPALVHPDHKYKQVYSVVFAGGNGPLRATFSHHIAAHFK